MCRIAGLSGLPPIEPELLEQWRTARQSSIYRAADDPLLLYETRPNYIAHDQKWSEAGGILRAADVPREKPAGTVRIAVLGDSISAMLAGRLTPGALPFPDLLEQHLDRPGRPVQVLNFGTDGYGTLQEARLFETKVIDYEPDVVLLQYCYNDTATSITPAIWFAAEGRPTSWLFSWLASLLRKEKVDEFDPKHARYAPNFGPVAPEEVAYWREMYSPDSVGWNRVVKGFDRIAAAAGKKIPVVLVVFPLLIEGPGPLALVDEMRSRVVGLGRQRGFFVLDLTDAFSRHPIRKMQEQPGRDVYHPSAFGHRIAALAISAFLAEKGLP